MWQNQNGSRGNVPALLAEIAALSAQCANLLNVVIAHHARCGNYGGGDAVHDIVAGALHGMPGTPLRWEAYGNLSRVIAGLNRAQAELQICVVEMSHGGMV